MSNNGGEDPWGYFPGKGRGSNRRGLTLEFTEDQEGRNGARFISGSTYDGGLCELTIQFDDIDAMREAVAALFGEEAMYQLMVPLSRGRCEHLFKNGRRCVNCGMSIADLDNSGPAWNNQDSSAWLRKEREHGPDHGPEHLKIRDVPDSAASDDDLDPMASRVDDLDAALWKHFLEASDIQEH